MKKTTFFAIVFTIFIPLASSAYAASSSEKVRVIRADKQQNDLIVERESGERLLIQHNRLCGSMSTEFPVDLLWSGEKITQLKVAVNEICKVYNFGPYTDDIKILKRIKSGNALIKDHLAEIQWGGKTFKIDYGKGCENLRNFEGQNAYIYALDSTLKSATLYLPRDRGQCTINSSELIGESEEEATIESPIKGLQYKAENNEAYFYWDEDTSDKKWLYLIANSRYKLNPSDYHYRQMPNLRYSRTNEYTAKTLANDMTYYFYLSARDKDGNVAPWTEVQITPTLTVKSFHNSPDPEPFEVVVDETSGTDIKLTWPDKSENSRRWLVQFFVDGKREIFKIIDGALTEYTIPNKSEYLGKGLRFIIKSTPKERFGVTYSDGVFWEMKE